MPNETVAVKIRKRVADLRKMTEDENDDEKKALLEARLSEAEYLLSVTTDAE